MTPDHAKEGSGTAFIASCGSARKRLAVTERVQQPHPMAYAPTESLPEGWIWASFSETCARVSVGHVGPTTEHFCTPEEGVMLVRSQNVRPGRLELQSCAYITKSFHGKLRKSQLRAGDILIVRVGANRGDVAVVPPASPPLNCANIVFARPLIATGFFQYFLRSSIGRDALLALTTGAAQGVINTESVAQLPVPVPPEDQQRRIASVLSAYDDLIENNTRRIAILEEMARLLYDEWFVQFRFPGHEASDFTETEEGRKPTNWAWTKIGNLCTKLQSGGTPSRSNASYWVNGTVDWYKTKELWDGFLLGSEEKIAERAISEGKARIFPQGTILMAIYGSPTVGRLGITTAPASCNQAALGFSPDTFKMRFWVLYFHLWNLRAKFNSMAQGAAQQNISKEKVMETIVLVPDGPAQERFEAITSSLMESSLNLQKRNLNLHAQRDLLLPKLISGEIDVSNLPLPGTEDQAA